MEDPNRVLYFIGNEPFSVSELKSRLRMTTAAERVALLAEILREARDVDVWIFTTPAEIADLWPQLAPKLGLRRPFWEFLLSEWQRQGFLDFHRTQ